MNAARDLVERSLSRFEFTLMLSMTMAVIAVSIDMILPAMGELREAFGLASDSNEVAGVITFVFLGLGAGQLVWGPISDSIGRKKVLVIGLGVYVIAAVAAAFAPTLEWLFIARLVGGFGGAGPLVIARSVVRDVYEGSAMAEAMSFIMAVFLLVPVIAPTVGRLVLIVAPWEWIFLCTGIFGIGLMVWTTRLPETLDPSERIPFRVNRLAGAARVVLSNPMTMGYTLAQTAMFGVFASYLASSQLIIDDIFGLDPWFPFIFGGTAIVMGITMLSNTRVLKRVQLRPLLRAGFTGYVVFSVLMAVVMVATDGTPPFLVFVLVLLPLLISHSFVIPNLNAIAMIPMGKVAGTAAAIIGTMSTLGGAVIGTTIDRMYDGTLVPFGVSAAVLGIISYALMRWADSSYRRHYPDESPEPRIRLLGTEHT